MNEQRQWTLVHGDGNRIVAQGEPLYEDEVALLVVPESELSLSLAREQRLAALLESVLRLGRIEGGVWHVTAGIHISELKDAREALSSVPDGKGR